MYDSLAYWFETRRVYRHRLTMPSAATRHTLSEAVQWCRDTYGPPVENVGRDAAVWDTIGEGQLFVFKHSEDAFAFKMRWL